MLSVDERDVRDLKWWNRHHESNVRHLLHRIEQMLNGEDVDEIIKATLEGYRRTYPKE